MKQRQISETLQAMIAKTSVTLNREGIRSSYSDRLVIELLADDNSCARRIVDSLAGEHGVRVIMRRIVSSLAQPQYMAYHSPQEHFDAMCATLIGMTSSEQLTSAHLLYAAAFDSTTMTSQALHSYGINASDVMREIERMEMDEVRWVS